jgi:hypothetical protein
MPDPLPLFEKMKWIVSRCFPDPTQYTPFTVDTERVKSYNFVRACIHACQGLVCGRGGRIINTIADDEPVDVFVEITDADTDAHEAPPAMDAPGRDAPPPHARKNGKGSKAKTGNGRKKGARGKKQNIPRAQILLLIALLLCLVYVANMSGLIDVLQMLRPLSRILGSFF